MYTDLILYTYFNKAKNQISSNEQNWDCRMQ